MYDTFPTPRFKNPYPEAIPVPLTEALSILTTPTPEEMEFLLKNAPTQGDAYVLSGTHLGYSVGIRHGKLGHECYDPLADQEKAAGLHQKYKGVAKLLADMATAVNEYEKSHGYAPRNVVGSIVELSGGLLYEYDGQRFRSRPVGTQLILKTPAPKMLPEFVFCVLPARKAFGKDHPKSIKSCVLLHSKAYWDANKHLDDHHQSKNLSHEIKKLIGEVQESVFESVLTVKAVREALERQGLTYSESMQTAFNDAYFY